jgi:glutathione synthase
MTLLVILNDQGDLRPGRTTTALISECLRRGMEVHVAGVGDLGLTDEGGVQATARRATRPAVGEAALVGVPVSVDLDAVDGVLVRTNPGRDARRAWAHDVGLQLLAHAERRGTRVLSRPAALMAGATKLSVARLPAALRPATLVSRDATDIRAFIDAAPGPCVLKPLVGTQGRDVFRVGPGWGGNAAQIVDLLTRDGFCMAQHFVPEATGGDVRVILLDEAPLVVGGRLAAVRRVPPGEDFRSNVAVGGQPSPPELTDAQVEVVEAVAEELAGQGLFMVGLDLIGTCVVELNVYSPGGLADAGRFADRDFHAAVVDALERHLGASGT